MDDVRARLEPWIELLPEPWREYWWAVGLAAVALVLLLAWAIFDRLVLRPLTRRRGQPATSEEHLRIDLGTFPAPVGDSPQRVLVEGLPARVRLAVVAPHGQYALPDDPGGLLDRVLPGLGTVARADGASVRVWPAQVSRAGFAPKFHTLVSTSSVPGQASRWVLAAGPVRSGPTQFSLGLALETDEPCFLGRLTVTPDRWNWLLRIQSP